MGKTKEQTKSARLGDKFKRHWKKFLGKDQASRSRESPSFTGEEFGSSTVTNSSKLTTQPEQNVEARCASPSPEQSSVRTPPDSGLWGKAAESLEPKDREKLNRIIKANRETPAIEGCGQESQVEAVGLDLVLERAQKLKEKDPKATWTNLLDRIIQTALSFKALGDAAVKFDKSGHAAFGWSVVSFGLQVAANAKAAHGFIISSSEVLTRFLKRYRKYETFRGQHDLDDFDDCLTEAYKAILLYELALYDYLQQGGIGRALHAVLPSEQRSVPQCDKNIHNADAEVRHWLQIIMVRNSSNSLQLQRIADQTSQRPSLPSEKCLQSLSFPQMDDRYNDIDKAEEGTCKWLLGHEKYRESLAHDRSLLWIKGNPGSGKSTLLRYALHDAIVECNIQDRHLDRGDEDMLPRNETVGTQAEQSALILSFFFHDRGVELQKTPLGLFRSLLHQLLRYVPDSLKDLVAAYETKCNSMGKPGKKWDWNMNELQSFFQSSLQLVLKDRPVWIFVDALDECGKDNANKLVKRFEDFLRGCASEAQIRICFSCRQYPILGLTYHNALEICLDRENKHDISTYVKARLSANSASPVPATIQKAITDRASGIFMWARLVVERVLELQGEGEGWNRIQNEIDTVPDELDGLYRKLLQDMEDKPYSLKLLQWISFALRPLTLEELRWALIVDADDSEKSSQQYQNSRDYDSNMEKRLKTISCGLVETVMSSNAQPVVQFIHQSVKDFFLQTGFSILHNSQKSAGTKTSELNVEGTAHYRLSRICIRYLALQEVADWVERHPCDFEDRPARKQAADELTSTFPLLDYATTSWIAHVQQSENRGIPQDDLLGRFGWPSEAIVQLWTQIYRLIGKSWEHPPKGTTMLHVVSTHQLMRPLQMILEEGQPVEIDVKDDDHQTPLYCSVENGCIAVVHALLKKGADINAQGGFFGSALQAASYNGHEAIVHALLENGADINAQGGLDGSALQVASKNGHKAIVDALLENGADINAQGGFFGNALQAASENGHEAIVDALLENGADINAQGGLDGSALQAASYNGHEAIVHALLKKGADINAQGGHFGNALQAASYTGHLQIVRMLFENGSPILDAIGNEGTSALISAAAEGHYDIVQELMARGADLNVSDTWGETALMRAAKRGHLSIVQVLTGGNIDLNTANQYGSTALLLAVQNGQSRVVNLLLQQEGINTNVEKLYSSLRRGLLVYALIETSDECVHHEVLTHTSSTELNQRDFFGMTPLAVAVAQGHDGTVKLMLQLPDTNLQQEHNRDNFGRSILWWAKSSGDAQLEEMVVKEALQRGIVFDDDRVPVLRTRVDVTDSCEDFCDLCTRKTHSDDGYGCIFCLPDMSTFVICPDCFLLGGRCLNESHRLRQRGLRKIALV